MTSGTEPAGQHHDMVRYASEFGLTALARSRLAAGINAPPPNDGKFAGLLG
jgi:hypothetical protein